jgi:tRNA (guanine-N(7)-)-methyltransferase subunit TRM82
MALLSAYGDFICVSGFRHISVHKIGTDNVISRDIQECDGIQICNGAIIATTFSLSGRYFAACTDAKHLSVWEVHDDWKHLSTRLLPRRPTSLVFTRCEKDLVVADKAGDVHRFSVVVDTTVALPSNNQTLLLGHVSMLLDLKLCAADKFLVTCDRDEKIRVSHFPNAYSIQSFCLGHTDYVSRLGYFEDIDLLISASGDGTIKLWNYQVGCLQDNVNCSEFLSSNGKSENTSNLMATTHPMGIRCLCCCAKKHHFAVSFDSQPVVLLFSIETDTTSRQHRLKFRHRLLLSATVVDIVFVADTYLLASQQSNDPASLLVSAFCLSQTADSSCLELTELSNDCTSSLWMTVQCINDNLQSSSDASVGHTGVVPVLRKARIDNMKDYIEKKRRRQEQECSEAV